VDTALTAQVVVADDGMLPAIAEGDAVMSARAWPQYTRGDLVEVHRGEKVVIRRIVGLPGEKVELIAGKLYVNDKQTSLHSNDKVYVDGAEVDVPQQYRDTTTNLDARTLGDGEYFVLADNPGLRSPEQGNGSMKKTGDEHIQGKVIFKIRGTSRFSNEGVTMYPLE
jgi:signal peptidase I